MTTPCVAITLSSPTSIMIYANLLQYIAAAKLGTMYIKHTEALHHTVGGWSPLSTVVHS